MRRYERVVLIDNAPLTKSAQTLFTDELQGGGGQGWYRAWLIIKNVFTLGTGSGAKTDEPELAVIKSIMLRSDKNEYFVNNIPGRPLFDLARLRAQYPPHKDAFAAASATYEVVIPIVFADDELARPEDTIIDTGRYESMSLGITMGAESDLLSTVGTSAAVFTVTLVVDRTVGRLVESQLPINHVSYSMSPPIDLSANTTIRLERGDGIRIKRALLYSGSSGSVSSPFSGAPANTIISTVELQDTVGYPLPKISASYLQKFNATDFKLAVTPPTGRYVVDFMKADENGSLFASYDTAKKSKVDFNLVAATAPANSIISCAVEQVRDLVGSEAAA